MKSKLLIILFFVISSCEHGYEYKYFVQNNTDSVLSLHVKTLFEDSGLLILPKTTFEFFKLDHGMEGAGGPFYRVITKDFEKIRINLGMSKQNYNVRKNKYWVFNKKNSFTAEYVLTVNSLDSFK